MIKKYYQILKYIILKTVLKIRYRSHIKFGITGSIIKIPEIQVSGNGIINIGSHCRFEKSQLAAIDGGEIYVGAFSAFGSNDIVVSHKHIKIGSRCLIAPNVSIYDHDHVFSENGIQPYYKTGDIEIGDNVWIGTGAVILKNTKIGSGCIIGAGTVVQGMIPPNTVVTGNRELQIRKIKSAEGNNNADSINNNSII